MTDDCVLIVLATVESNKFSALGSLVGGRNKFSFDFSCKMVDPPNKMFFLFLSNSSGVS